VDNPTVLNTATFSGFDATGIESSSITPGSNALVLALAGIARGSGSAADFTTGEGFSASWTLVGEISDAATYVPVAVGAFWAKMPASPGSESGSST